MATWHTPASAREHWADAPGYPEDEADVLVELLEVAREQVEAYAPALPLPAEGEALEIPATYRYAQLMQARNIWNASTVSPGGDLGEGDFTITVHPLDWTVKQMLRPKRAVPVVG